VLALQPVETYVNRTFLLPTPQLSNNLSHIFDIHLHHV
jgi:hypothetical protein